MEFQRMMRVEEGRGVSCDPWYHETSLSILLLPTVDTTLVRDNGGCVTGLRPKSINIQLMPRMMNYDISIMPT